MQWVINRTGYHPAAAEKIYSRNNAPPRAYPQVTPIRETLYRGNNGQYFVCIQGQSVQHDEVVVLHVLPLTREKAVDWCAEAGVELGTIDKHVDTSDWRNTWET